MLTKTNHETEPKILYIAVLEKGSEVKAHSSNPYLNLDYLQVLLYPLNVKTAEPIGPTLSMATHMTPGKVYGPPKLKNS